MAVFGGSTAGRRGERDKLGDALQGNKPCTTLTRLHCGSRLH